MTLCSSQMLTLDGLVQTLQSLKAEVIRRVRNKFYVDFSTGEDFYGEVSYA